METQSIEIEIFQMGGYDEAIVDAKHEAERRINGFKAQSAKFLWASSREGAGRWVGIEVTGVKS